jgi:two-component system heavy metal sensor histidine kinase CusS
VSIIRPSLRLRLTLWFLATFLVVFTIILYGAWLLYRGATRRLLDDRLLQLAEGVAAMLQADDAPSLEDGLRRFQPIERTFSALAVRDAEGTVLASRWPVDTESLPALPDGPQVGDAVVSPLSGERARQLLGRSVTSRMITYRFMMPDGRVRHLDLAGTTDMAREEQSFLHDVFIVGALGSLLASAIAAWLIAGQAVEPMREMTEAAGQIDPEHISARVDVTDKSVEVERLQAALNAALARLEEGYRAQERFISNVAHDLKTPIAVMLTESQVLRSESVTLEEFEEYRQSMIDEMQRLGGLVESFLTLARADRGDALARVTEVSGIDVLMEAVSACDHEAARLDVRLVPTVDQAVPDRDIELRGDPDLLRALLVNLIRNGIRHSPAGETVDIGLRDGAEGPEFSVRDRGPGIADELHEAVFDRFVQAPDDQPRVAGTGLGLAIAKSVVDLHGGTIAVENCHDRGCAFTVRLPPRVPPVDPTDESRTARPDRGE